MSMTSDPSHETFTDPKVWMASHAGLAATFMGDCFDSAGKRYQLWGSGVDHKVAGMSMDGQAAATMTFAKFGGDAGWRKIHDGHALTHMGSMVSPKGTMDVWFCQKDKEFCYDAKS